jgi:hypothetical protein
MDSIGPGDYVIRPKRPDIRGIVMWTDRSDVFVCWETGYEPYIRENASDLEKINVLDLLVDGRELNFEHTPQFSRCKCGCRLAASRRKELLICPSCRVYYNSFGALVDHEPFEPGRPEAPKGADDDVLAHVRRVRRSRLGQ